MRFYCHTSAHNRFIHFKTSNPNAVSIAIDSRPSPLTLTDWTTNFTSLPPLFDNKREASYLPAASNRVGPSTGEPRNPNAKPIFLTPLPSSHMALVSCCGFTAFRWQSMTATDSVRALIEGLEQSVCLSGVGKLAAWRMPSRECPCTITSNRQPTFPWEIHSLAPPCRGKQGRST